MKKKILSLIVISMLIFITACGNKEEKIKKEWPENTYTTTLEEPAFGKIVNQYEDEERQVIEYDNVKIDELKKYIEKAKVTFPYYNSVEDTYDTDKKYQFVGENENRIITISFDNGHVKITIL